MRKKHCIEKVLMRKDPGRFVHAPNYWQWFTHQKAHGLLPKEAAHCESQLDFIRHMGLDVFSRNVYSDPRAGWWGGLSEPIYEGIEVNERVRKEGQDSLTERTVRTPTGVLSERLRYIHSASTLVQEKHLVNDFEKQLEALEAFVFGSSWKFKREKFDEEQAKIGDDGLLIAGEFFSPLKLLHILLGPEDTTYLIEDEPQLAERICRQHESAQLELMEAMVTAGVPAVMSMDNLDTVFHTPDYVDRLSAPFYERASQLCHKHGSVFLIHACGQQRDNLRRIAALGVDGLEGVAFPPVGDIALKEALEMTGERFILSGGITPNLFNDFSSQERVEAYCENLFRELEPFRNRFIFGASCNTPITARYEQLLWFRDAWRKYGC